MFIDTGLSPLLWEEKAGTGKGGEYYVLKGRLM